MVNGIKSDWAPAVSGVSQGTVLGPLLFSLYINDISADIEPEIRLFADDCVCYREIKNEEDTFRVLDNSNLGVFYVCFSFRTPKIHCHGFSLTPCFFLVTRPKLSINCVKK